MEHQYLKAKSSFLLDQCLVLLHIHPNTLEFKGFNTQIENGVRTVYYGTTKQNTEVIVTLSVVEDRNDEPGIVYIDDFRRNLDEKYAGVGKLLLKYVLSHLDSKLTIRLGVDKELIQYYRMCGFRMLPYYTNVMEYKRYN